MNEKISLIGTQIIPAGKDMAICLRTGTTAKQNLFLCDRNGYIKPLKKCHLNEKITDEVITELPNATIGICDVVFEAKGNFLLCAQKSWPEETKCIIDLNDMTVYTAKKIQALSENIILYDRVWDNEEEKLSLWAFDTKTKESFLVLGQEDSVLRLDEEWRYYPLSKEKLIISPGVTNGMTYIRDIKGGKSRLALGSDCSIKFNCGRPTPPNFIPKEKAPAGFIQFWSFTNQDTGAVEFCIDNFANRYTTETDRIIVTDRCRRATLPLHPEKTYFYNELRTDLANKNLKILEVNDGSSDHIVMIDKNTRSIKTIARANSVQSRIAYYGEDAFDVKEERIENVALKKILNRAGMDSSEMRALNFYSNSITTNSSKPLVWSFLFQNDKLVAAVGIDQFWNGQTMQNYGSPKNVDLTNNTCIYQLSLVSEKSIVDACYTIFTKGAQLTAQNTIAAGRTAGIVEVEDIGDDVENRYQYHIITIKQTGNEDNLSVINTAKGEVAFELEGKFAFGCVHIEEFEKRDGDRAKISILCFYDYNRKAYGVCLENGTPVIPTKYASIGNALKAARKSVADNVEVVLAQLEKSDRKEIVEPTEDDEELWQELGFEN